MGELRHRITIERVNHVTLTGGAEEETTEALATVWASKEDLSGREWFQAMQIQSEVSTRFKIRYRADVYPQMQIVYGLEIYRIEAILDPDGRREQLHLMCSRQPIREEWVFLMPGFPVQVQ
jgi:SPP1 family predicted phage head-tail adaptor